MVPVTAPLRCPSHEVPNNAAGPDMPTGLTDKERDGSASYPDDKKNQRCNVPVKVKKTP